VRCFIIGLGAEVHIYRIIATETLGKYTVARDERHLRELLLEPVAPPPVSQEQAPKKSGMVEMGFPTRFVEPYPAFCICHRKMTIGGYVCPRCQAKICELPMHCALCDLMLVSSPQLTRSYHHLFPVCNFEEIQGGSG